MKHSNVDSTLVNLILYFVELQINDQVQVIWDLRCSKISNLFRKARRENCFIWVLKEYGRFYDLSLNLFLLKSHLKDLFVEIVNLCKIDLVYDYFKKKAVFLYNIQ